MPISVPTACLSSPSAAWEINFWLRILLLRFFSSSRSRRELTVRFQSKTTKASFIFEGRLFFWIATYFDASAKLSNRRLSNIARDDAKRKSDSPAFGTPSGEGDDAKRQSAPAEVKSPIPVEPPLRKSRGGRAAERGKQKMLRCQ